MMKISPDEYTEEKEQEKIFISLDKIHQLFPVAYCCIIRLKVFSFNMAENRKNNKIKKQIFNNTFDKMSNEDYLNICSIFKKLRQNIIDFYINICKFDIYFEFHESSQEMSNNSIHYIMK